jgi:hypothetical protein
LTNLYKNTIGRVRVCSGGGFLYAGLGGKFKNVVHGEVLDFIEYDSKEGGEHGFLAAAGIKNAVVGI